MFGKCCVLSEVAPCWFSEANLGEFSDNRDAATIRARFSLPWIVERITLNVNQDWFSNRMVDFPVILV